MHGDIPASFGEQPDVCVEVLKNGVVRDKTVVISQAKIEMKQGDCSLPGVDGYAIESRQREDEPVDHVHKPVHINVFPAGRKTLHKQAVFEVFVLLGHGRT